ncbi:DNA polymerase ligase N-terminal domain-containing protein [Achromobacter insolitus]|uniref:DNA polymerase ligase N-terminal domain-containing protein n=1 Tax=Achromobacter insolitus TaxID=217204 RepID=UPI001CD343F0
MGNDAAPSAGNSCEETCVGSTGRRFVVYRSVNRPDEFELHLQVGALMKRWTIVSGMPLDHLAQRFATEQPPVGAASRMPSRRGEILRLDAGAASIWDTGDWFIASGIGGHRSKRFRFTLQGEILHGGWTLVRVFGGRATKRPVWLLVLTSSDASSGITIATRQWA